MISVSPSSHSVNKRKARDLNPHHLSVVARISSAARQTVSGYLPLLSGPKGNRTLPPILQGSVAPLEHSSPFESEVRPGIDPGLRPYHRRVLPQHLQTLSLSDRGWNRTIDLLHVTQTSSPLDHAIVF